MTAETMLETFQALPALIERRYSCQFQFDARGRDARLTRHLENRQRPVEHALDSRECRGFAVARIGLR